MRHWLVIAGIGVGSACGSDGSGPSGGEPLTTEDARSLCQDFCGHAVSCGWTTNATTCQTQCEGSVPMFRGDGMRVWIDCEIAADCSTQNVGEACYIDPVGAISSRPIHDEYVEKCAGLATTCPGVVVPTHTCDLDGVKMFSDSYMTSHVMPCFATSCTQVSACLETNVLDAF